MNLNELNEFTNREIARELLLEHNPNVTEKQFEEIWGACKGNPYNIVPLYQIVEMLRNKQKMSGK